LHCFRVGGYDEAVLGLHYSLAGVVAVLVVGAARVPHCCRVAVVYVTAHHERKA